MRALNDTVVIEPIKEEVVASSGMIMGDKDKNELRYMKGKVLSVSDSVTEFNVGDTILYDKVRAYEAKIDGISYTFIRRIDAVAVL